MIIFGVKSDFAIGTHSTATIVSSLIDFMVFEPLFQVPIEHYKPNDNYLTQRETPTGYKSWIFDAHCWCDKIFLSFLYDAENKYFCSPFVDGQGEINGRDTASVCLVVEKSVSAHSGFRVSASIILEASTCEQKFRRHAIFYRRVASHLLQVQFLSL
jgi:hypothetical protein